MNYNKIPGTLYQDLAEDEFRTITLLPASDFSDPLHVQLSISKRSDPPEYKALSYVWGSTQKTSTIYVNGLEFQATENLVSALRHIREAAPGDTETLWVDAICINQLDEQERSRQVQKMDTIYRGAEEVIAWLGESEDNSDEGMKLLNRWGPALAKLGVTKLNVVKRLWKELLQDEEYVRSLVESIDDPFSEIGWKALPGLVNRPYWRRLWTFQEFVLPRRVYVMCGAYRVKVEYFNVFSNVVRWWADFARHLESFSPEVLARVELQKLDTPPLWRVLDLIQYRQVIQDERTFDLEYGIVCEYPMTTLLGMLWECSRLLCGDPRDKIFSMIAFWRDSTPEITADYSKSVEEVYAEFARDCILNSRLQVLCFAGIGCKSVYSSTLPSWVPDWEQMSDSLRGLLTPSLYNCYSAGFMLSAIRPAKMPPTVGREPDRIIIQGVLFDTIAEVYMQDAGESNSWNRPNHADCKLLIKNFCEGPTSGVTMPLLQAFFRTLVTDVHQNGARLWFQPLVEGEDISPLDDEYAGGFAVNFLKKYCVDEGLLDLNFDGKCLEPERRELMDVCPLPWGTFFAAGQKPSPDKWEQYKRCAAKYDVEFDRIVWSSTHIRSFFTTTKGYMGSGPPFVAEGDVVCIFEDGRVPFVLRKGVDGYRLVGEAFVVGLMDRDDVVRHGYADQFESIEIY